MPLFLTSISDSLAKVDIAAVVDYIVVVLIFLWRIIFATSPLRIVPRRSHVATRTTSSGGIRNTPTFASAST